MWALIDNKQLLGVVTVVLLQVASYLNYPRHTIREAALRRTFGTTEYLNLGAGKASLNPPPCLFVLGKPEAR